MKPDRYALVQDPGNGANIMLLATSDDLDYLTLVASQFGPFRATNYLKTGFPVSWAPPAAMIRRQFFRDRGGFPDTGALFEDGRGTNFEIIDLESVGLVTRANWIAGLILHAKQFCSDRARALIDQNQGDNRADVDQEYLDTHRMSEEEAEALVP